MLFCLFVCFLMLHHFFPLRFTEIRKKQAWLSLYTRWRATIVSSTLELCERKSFFFVPFPFYTKLSQFSVVCFCKTRYKHFTLTLLALESRCMCVWFWSKEQGKKLVPKWLHIQFCTCLYPSIKFKLIYMFSFMIIAVILHTSPLQTPPLCTQTLLWCSKF